MSCILLKNGIVVNSKKCSICDILIEGEKIKKVLQSSKKKTLVSSKIDKDIKVIDCTGKYIFPGFIDGHTHLIYQLQEQRL